MFYADVPTHRFLLIGSRAWGGADEFSDLDVVISGPAPEDLDHPYFQNLVRTLEPGSVARGGRLDLFYDDPANHRFVGIYTGAATAIAPGRDAYRAMVAEAREISIFDLARMAATAAEEGTAPALAPGQIAGRQGRKSALLDRIVARHRARTATPTYRVSVHEAEDPIRPGHGTEPGWIQVERSVARMGLRAVVRGLREEGYDNSAILIESEAPNPFPASRSTDTVPVSALASHPELARRATAAFPPLAQALGR